MSPFIIGLLVFAFVFGAAFLALLSRAMLPEHHLSIETMDTVKLTMGVVATLSAMVLGLLIASAKNSNDAAKNDVTAIIARIEYTDRLLSIYGTEASEARLSLHIAAQHMKERLWPVEHGQKVQLDPHLPSTLAVYQVIAKLQPKDDNQKDLKARILGNVYELGQMHWLVFEQTGSSISRLMLVILICWLIILFVSFGLFAPFNGTAITSLLLAALIVAGAIFLLLELDEPFGGLIQISSRAMDNTLQYLGK